MLTLIGNNLFESFLKARPYIQYSTKGVAKWGEELSSQIKLDIEKHWRPIVTECRENNLNNNESEYYTLSMFPYPSGQLHMGHVRVYSISDTISRFHKLNGEKVIHPMGWDAFGLPAENAAFDRHIPPQVWTKDNIKKMKSQLLDLGCSFDWERELNTSDPSYYKWTQSLFLDLYKAGMVYRKEAFVNWDPVDQTVLADEQVDENGCSWRSGAKVEKKLLNQWFIRTTKFAKQLYDGLEDPILVDWRDIIQLQKHWIGECNGISIDFKLSNGDSNEIKSLKIWTNKPEKLLCGTFIAVPIGSILDKENFISNECGTYKELNILAENPITKKNIPILVTNEVTYAEGTQAYLLSSEMDEADVNFFIQSNLQYSNFTNKSLDEITKLRKEVCDIVKEKNVGVYPVSSKLNDWLISRQRYWGTPIPIVYCEACGEKPVAAGDLPIILPEINLLNRTKNSPLMKAESWINTVCPECGGKATRETDTMDTFVDSSWYFLRYLDPKNNFVAFDKDKIKNNFPIDLYIGGKEHAVLHLYYARFMSHFLHSIGKLPQKEPFRRLLVQGMVMGKAYKVKETGQYIPQSEVKILNEKKGHAVTQNDKAVEILWEKMSKSKHNGVDPTEMFEKYGCDTTRLFMLGDVAPTSFRHWSDATFPGILNWQRRLWLTTSEFIKLRNSPAINENEKKTILNSNEFKTYNASLWESWNYFVSAVTFNFQFTYQLSVAISRLQGLSNCLRKVPPVVKTHSKEYECALAYTIIMLAPIAPHFSSELWSGFVSATNPIECKIDTICLNKDVLEQKWPLVDSNYKLDLICKANGAKLGEVKLLPSEINELNHKKAIEIILNNKLSSKIKSNNSIFYLYPNCHAIINFVN